MLFCCQLRLMAGHHHRVTSFVSGADSRHQYSILGSLYGNLRPCLQMLDVEGGFYVDDVRSGIGLGLR